MSAAPDWLRGGRAAVTFLTRVPVGGFPYSAGAWRWSSGWFPLVGAAVGAAGAAVLKGTAPALGLWVASLLAVSTTLLLTGAFHEDGLADTADALGGASEREKVLDILKDSRVGTFGAAALFLSLGLRVALLERLAGLAPIAMVLAHGLSRVPPVWLMGALPYVSRDQVSKSKQVARAGRGQVLLATLWGALFLGLALLAGWMTPSVAIWMLAALAAVALLCGWRFRARLGGLTGDFLGAAQQVAECTALLVCALGRGA